MHRLILAASAAIVLCTFFVVNGSFVHANPTAANTSATNSGEGAKCPSVTKGLSAPETRRNAHGVGPSIAKARQNFEDNCERRLRRALRSKVRRNHECAGCGLLPNVYKCDCNPIFQNYVPDSFDYTHGRCTAYITEQQEEWFRCAGSCGAEAIFDAHCAACP